MTDGVQSVARATAGAFTLEALEPRLMMSADTVAFVPVFDPEDQREAVIVADMPNPVIERKDGEKGIFDLADDESLAVFFAEEPTEAAAPALKHPDKELARVVSQARVPKPEIGSDIAAVSPAVIRQPDPGVSVIEQLTETLRVANAPPGQLMAAAQGASLSEGQAGGGDPGGGGVAPTGLILANEEQGSPRNRQARGGGAPSGLNLVITGGPLLNFKGTTVLASVTGNGDASPDTLTLTVAPALTGNTTLAVDAGAQQFLRTAGSFLTDGFEIGDEIIASGFLLNDGTYRITAVTATSLTVAETLLPGDATGSGDESIVSPGKIVIAGLVGGGGLQNITIQASDEIEIRPGKIISSRQVAPGDDPFINTSASVADSGHITLSAPVIVAGGGAGILAGANGAFTAGDVLLTATDTENVILELRHRQRRVPQPVVECQH
jgi:hypothetical protein